jgi:hypothetical protein
VRVGRGEKGTDTHNVVIYIFGREGGPAVRTAKEHSSAAYGRVARDLVMAARAGLGRGSSSCLFCPKRSVH